MSQVVANPAAGNPVAKSPAQTLVDKQMQKALAQHQSGKLKEAEEYYRQVLRLHPDHPDANNLLGVLLFFSPTVPQRGLAIWTELSTQSHKRACSSTTTESHCER